MTPLSDQSDFLAAAKELERGPFFKGNLRGGELVRRLGVDMVEWNAITQTAFDQSAANAAAHAAQLEEFGAHPATIVAIDMFAVGFVLGINYGKRRR